MSANVTTTGFTIRMYQSAPTSHRRVSLQLTSAFFIGQCGGFEELLSSATWLPFIGAEWVSCPFQLGFRLNLLASITYELQTDLQQNKSRAGVKFCLFDPRREPDTITFHAWPIVASRMEVDTHRHAVPRISPNNILTLEVRY